MKKTEAVDALANILSMTIMAGFQPDSELQMKVTLSEEGEAFAEKEQTDAVGIMMRGVKEIAGVLIDALEAEGLVFDPEEE